MLHAAELSIGYGGQSLAAGLNLTLKPGRLYCLLGPNGVGKSTLIRTLVGMQQPLTGSVKLNEQPLHTMDARRRAQQLAVVLTDRVDAPTLTVYELVALGRHPHTGWLGQLRSADHAIVRSALQAVGAVHLAEQAISSLSDGQRQKALIARALAQQPQVLVLDEPTAYLDIPHRVEVMRILRQLAHEQQRAVLLSTHDLDLALSHADRVWLMAYRGRQAVLHSGTPEDLVLQGAFQATFDRGQVAFDIESGTFTIESHTHHTVKVTGEGPRTYWTERALTRMGFRIAPQAALHVAVTPEGWELHQPAQPSQTAHSIEHLLELLTPR